MTLDSLVEADILSTCNALGSEIRGVYQKSADCLNCLRDLLRYLRRDDENHSVLRQLGSLRLLQTDLLPIVIRYYKDGEIFDLVLRLLIALTNPAILLFKENVPDDKLTCNIYLQLISYLQGYKKAFTDVSIWKVFCEFLKDNLKKGYIERTEEENTTVERILIVIRNILHIPPDEEELKRTDDDISMHDQILWGLHLSEIDLLFLYLTTNDEEHHFCLHILEIMSLMLREQKPEILLKTGELRSNEDKKKDEKDLVLERKRELELKLRKVPLCKPRFNGVYSVKNMKSISDNEYIAHKFITNFDTLKFDAEKNKKRRAKNRQPIVELDMTRRSTLCIRLVLKKFCLEFLKCYNTFMALVRRSLLQKRAEDHDDSYYLWAMHFFMEFNRHSKFQAAYVSETISIQIFHYIQTQIDSYREMLMTDKKKTKCWSKRIHLGLSAYRELLETLNAMEKSSDESINRAANVIASNVFYVIEYREMLLSLMLSFDDIKFSLSYLAELVEATHLFLKMLENHSKKRSVIVQKRKRKTKKKAKSSGTQVEVPPGNAEEQLDITWDAISGDLSAVVQGRKPITEDITPFDATSDLNFEEQKVEAVFKIREAMIERDAGKTVALLRAARNLWPEGDSFGATDIDEEDEFMICREIFYSELQRSPVKTATVYDEQDLSEDDEEENLLPCVVEQQLNLNDVYKRYASPKVMESCCLLLENYVKNSPRTNLSLIKLLYRLAWESKMHALFFQASLFLTFQKVFKDPNVHINPVIKEIYKFARFILSKFFEVAAKNSKIFVEMLFWKGPREAYELEEGYDKSESSSSKLIWTEDEEEELKYLYDENRNVRIDGQDIIDIILANLNKNRTRKQVLLKLQKLGLIRNAHDIKILQNEWQEAEVIELQELYAKYKNSANAMADILENLTIKRSRNAIVNKLLELNIIQDRKEVRKSKVSNKKRTGNYESNDSDSESSETNSSSSESVNFNNLNDSNQELNAENSEFNPPQSNGKMEWSEEEILKLHDLYNENSHSSSIARRISESFENRSKKDIKKKLMELNLLSKVIPTESSDSSSKQRSKKMNKSNEQIKPQRKRAPKEWDEQEIIELNTLFHEHKNSGDVVNSIVNQLSIKRPKQKIIEKLLEQGLIKDRKEVRKKKKSYDASGRKGKMNIKKPSFNESYNEFSETENAVASDDDDSEEDFPLSHLASVSQSKHLSSERNEMANSSHSSNFQRKKRVRLLSDGTDEENIDGYDKQSVRGNIKKVSDSDEIQDSVTDEYEVFHVSHSGTPLLPKHPGNEDIISNSYQNSEPKGVELTTQRRKRKRLVLDDSDDDAEDSAKQNNPHESMNGIQDTSPGVSFNDSINDTECFGSKYKKKQHVIEDSDESD